VLGLVDVTAELRGVEFRDSVAIWQRKLTITHCPLDRCDFKKLSQLI
jgi:hypothetical protein